MNEHAARQPDSTRVAIEVTAGVIPGRPEPEHTRRWAITSGEWHTLTTQPTGAAAEALAQLAGRANGYATLLQLQPDRHNWVRVDWIWF